MSDIKTNRDLYLAISRFEVEQVANHRSLEDYLSALLKDSARFFGEDALSVDSFYQLLNRSFSGESQVFEDDWRSAYETLPIDENGPVGWQAVVTRQIVDLHEMAEKGYLNDSHNYFGIDSPRGQRWYNFDPIGYLECAVTGTFGGWQPDDQTNRQDVSGKVALVHNDESTIFVDPEKKPITTFELSEVSWEQFKEFLWCGQLYE